MVLAGDRGGWQHDGLVLVEVQVAGTSHPAATEASAYSTASVAAGWFVPAIGAVASTRGWVEFDGQARGHEPYRDDKGL